MRKSNRDYKVLLDEVVFKFIEKDKERHLRVFPNIACLNEDLSGRTENSLSKSFVIPFEKEAAREILRISTNAPLYAPVESLRQIVNESDHFTRFTFSKFYIVDQSNQEISVDDYVDYKKSFLVFQVAALMSFFNSFKNLKKKIIGENEEDDQITYLFYKYVSDQLFRWDEQEKIIRLVLNLDKDFLELPFFVGVNREVVLPYEVLSPGLRKDYEEDRSIYYDDVDHVYALSFFSFNPSHLDPIFYLSLLSSLITDEKDKNKTLMDQLICARELLIQLRNESKKKVTVNSDYSGEDWFHYVRGILSNFKVDPRLGFLAIFCNIDYYENQLERHPFFYNKFSISDPMMVFGGSAIETFLFRVPKDSNESEIYQSLSGSFDQEVSDNLFSMFRNVSDCYGYILNVMAVRGFEKYLNMSLEQIARLYEDLFTKSPNRSAGKFGIRLIGTMYYNIFNQDAYVLAQVLSESAKVLFEEMPSISKFLIDQYMSNLIASVIPMIMTETDRHDQLEKIVLTNLALRFNVFAEMLKRGIKEFR